MKLKQLQQSRQLLSYIQSIGLDWDGISDKCNKSAGTIQGEFYRLIGFPVQQSWSSQRNKKIIKRPKKSKKMTSSIPTRQQLTSNLEYFQCTICLNVFDSYISLRKHRAVKHKNKNFRPECSFCRARQNKYSLNRHQELCVIKTFGSITQL